VDVLGLLPSPEICLKAVFVGKRGNPMSKWAEHNWAPCLEKLKIRHRKFYASRHTFITVMVESGQNLKAIADYCGTSVAMIEKDYCARQGFNLDRTNLTQQKMDAQNVRENLVAGPGFEPGTSRL
jgi:integrase